MLFIIQCFDKEGMLEVRKSTRAAHLTYIASAGTRLKYAGPMMMDEENMTPVGSLLLLDAASEGAAHLFANNDPYAKAGLFEKVVIKPTVQVLGDWLPKEK